MRQRPRDPDPVAHLPRRRPRIVAHHWSDTATRFVGLVAVGLVIILAAAGRSGA